MMSICFVLAQLMLFPTQALGYCGGLTSFAGYWLSGGVQDFSDASQLSEVTGYIQGFNPQPVVNVSTAWNMLARGGSGLAQGGWVFRAGKGWTTEYVLAAFRTSAGAYSEFYQYTIPTFSHNYGVRKVAGTTGYQFSYDGSVWLATGDLGWTPNHIEIMGETQNHGDHFPGSAAPGPYVEFWGSTHTVLGLGYPNSLSSSQYLSTGDVVGKTWLSGNDFYLWDKRCTDGG